MPHLPRKMNMINRSGTDQVMTQTFNRRKLSSYWSTQHSRRFSSMLWAQLFRYLSRRHIFRHDSYLELNICVLYIYTYLVGGFNPLKYISQIGSFPQVGIKRRYFAWLFGQRTITDPLGISAIQTSSFLSWKSHWFSAIRSMYHQNSS